MRRDNRGGFSGPPFRPGVEPLSRSFEVDPRMRGLPGDRPHDPRVGERRRSRSRERAEPARAAPPSSRPDMPPTVLGSVPLGIVDPSTLRPVTEAGLLRANVLILERRLREAEEALANERRQTQDATSKLQEFQIAAKPLLERMATLEITIAGKDREIEDLGHRRSALELALQAKDRDVEAARTELRQAEGRTRGPGGAPVAAPPALGPLQQQVQVLSQQVALLREKCGRLEAIVGEREAEIVRLRKVIDERVSEGREEARREVFLAVTAKENEHAAAMRKALEDAKRDKDAALRRQKEELEAESRRQREDKRDNECIHAACNATKMEGSAFCLAHTCPAPGCGMYKGAEASRCRRHDGGSPERQAGSRKRSRSPQDDNSLSAALARQRKRRGVPQPSTPTGVSDPAAFGPDPEAERLKIQVVELLRSVNEHKTRIRQLESVLSKGGPPGSVDDLQQKLAGVRMQIESLNVSLEGARKESAGLRQALTSELAKAQRAASETDGLRKKIDQLQKEVDAAQRAQRDSEQSSGAAVAAARDELSAAQRRADELNDALRTAEEARVAAQARAEEAGMQRLSGGLTGDESEAVREEIIRMQRLLNDTRAAEARHRDAHERLKNNFMKAQEAATTARREAQEARDKMEQLRVALDEACITQDGLLGSLMEADARVATLSADADKARRDLCATQDELERLNKQHIVKVKDEPGRFPKVEPQSALSDDENECLEVDCAERRLPLSTFCLKHACPVAGCPRHKAADAIDCGRHAEA